MSYFIFGDFDTRNYEQVCVFEDDVDSSPARVYEEIAIPGRNGMLLIDLGRYENGKNSYDIVVPNDYISVLTEIRNELMSRTGYHRLKDGFNPNEYYMAKVEDDLQPKQTVHRDGGVLHVDFTRKPQRWLTSGETTVTVASGAAIINPTLYDASPLLAVDGTGTVNLGEQAITVQGVALGKIIVGSSQSFSETLGIYEYIRKSFTIDTSNLVTGDTITLGAITFTDVYDAPNSGSSTSSIEVVDDTTLNGASFNWNISGLTATKMLSIPAGITLTFGTQWSGSYSVRVKYMYPPNSYRITDFGIATLSYDGASKISFTARGEDPESQCEVTFGETAAVSTKTVHDTIYIDLDVGEAYWIQDGKAVDANNLVALGSDLPVLEPGENAITYDSTITGLTIKPRWWRL